MSHIDQPTRLLVISIMATLSTLAGLTLMFLKTPASKTDQKLEKETKTLFKSVTKPFRLLTDKHMPLLIPAALYNGVELAFFVAIYPTAVGFTEAFGDSRKLVGFAGIVMALGCLTGGLFTGLFIDKLKCITASKS